MTIRVLVADDQDIVRAGFGALLDTQPDMTVVGSAGDGAEAVRLCRERKPDVVLMDVRMPVVDGIEATRQLAASGDGGPRVLMLTTFDLDEYVYDALLAPAVTRRLIGEFARMRPRPATRPERLEELTAREVEVLRLVAEGLSNGEIAERLVVSDETVKTHVSHVLRKLGLRDRAQAVVVANESGLVIPGA